MSSVVDKARAIAANPVEGLYRVRYRGRREQMLERHARLAREAGIDRLYLVLSFDCDTREDADVVVELHRTLADMGVPAVYAVPGELLERGATAYREIAAAGGEFLNHGYREHTVRDPETGICHSTLFYDEMTEADVVEDIRRGHDAVTRVLGAPPRGFRVPHFGTFQGKSALRFLHRLLAQLDYAYSSSTVPAWGIHRGPVFDELGLLELPVSGMGSSPLEILDTWSCWAAPDRTLAAEDYVREGRAAAEALAAHGAGVLNYYADPSHVFDQPLFFETVRRWVELSEPVTYRQLLDRCGRPF